MFKSITTWVLLAFVAVQAVPTPVVESIDLNVRAIAPRAVQSGLANFDRLNSSASGINDIGYYGGLRWNGISVVGANNGRALAAIRPQSLPNVAAYGIINSLDNPSRNITANFTGSRTISFSISSFYFGCVEATTTNAVGCKVAIAGYDRNDQLIAYQPNYFRPTNTANRARNNAQLATLSARFTGLSYVRLATQFVGQGVQGSTVLDDVRYTIITR